MQLLTLPLCPKFSFDLSVTEEIEKHFIRDYAAGVTWLLIERWRDLGGACSCFPMMIGILIGNASQDAKPVSGLHQSKPGSSMAKTSMGGVR